jgi:hypothetical protein
VQGFRFGSKPQLKKSLVQTSECLHIKRTKKAEYGTGQEVTKHGKSLGIYFYNDNFCSNQLHQHRLKLHHQEPNM